MQLPVVGELLEHDTHLEIWCCRHDCRREVRWPAQVAVAKLGASCTYVRAARRLRCSACGASGRNREIRCRPCVLDQSAQRWRDRCAREGREP